MPKSRRISRRFALVAVLAAAALSAFGAASAGAHTTFTTTYYTIDTAASPSSAHLFLGTGRGGGVTQQAYVSGSLAQQWVPIADLVWPGVSPITGSSGLGGIVDCLGHWSCPFHVDVNSGPRKFVNRLTGQCMAMIPWRDGMTKATLKDCATSGAAMRAQVFGWAFSKGDVAGGFVPRTLTALVQTPNSGRPLCDGWSALAPGAPVAGFPCGTSMTPSANQSFRFLQVASVTCSGAAAKMSVCGLPRP